MTEKSGKSIRSILRKLAGPYGALRHYLTPYRKRFTLGLVFGALFGFVNGTLPLVIQQVSSVVFYGKVQNPYLVRIIGNGGAATTPIIVIACLAIPSVMLLRGFFSYLNTYFVEWVSGRILMDLRGALVEKITAQSLDFFNHSRTGQLLSRIMNDTREAQSVMRVLSTDLIAQPIGLITGLVVLFSIDYWFMIGTILLFPLCLLPARKVGKKIRAAAHREEADKGEMMVIMHEVIAGIKVVKSFSRAGYEVKRFNASSESQFQQAMRVLRAMETLTPIIEGLAALGIGLAFFYVHASHLPGYNFVALCGGIYMLYGPIKTLTRLHLLLQRCLIATTSLFDLMNLTPTVRDLPNAKKLGNCAGKIVFENVGFSYRKEIPALTDINLTFEPGGYYALVGESGAGKSTLLSLIMRFYDPVTGVIRIDGVDLRELEQDSLRDRIGVVTQDTFLFHETIFRNIAYGKLDATKEEVVAAAKLAHAHEFILAQQNGYDTVVGDKGCMLSGGQQQRIAIARALLKNAPILLLDEATSSLDSASENQIQSALEVLSSGRTVIAIAHRLSTILKADRIIVLDQGRVKETGSHQELLDQSGHYRRLYDLQFNRSREDESQNSSLLPAG